LPSPIYISEAHPEDEWQMDSNKEDGFVFKPDKAEARLARLEW
jgi:hypothetical protein